MSSIDIAFVSAITALVAVILSPIVSLYTVKKQFGAQVHSTSRQAWINQLRAEVADVTSLATYIALLIDTGQLNESEHGPLHRDGYRHWVIICTLINPNEKDHAQLAKCVEELLRLAYSEKDRTPEGVRLKTDEVISIAQAVFKREWIRVKKGI